MRGKPKEGSAGEGGFATGCGRSELPTCLLACLSLLSYTALSLLSLAPLAVGAAAPTVSPGVASNLSDSGASLNARLDPQGQPTTYHFEYGLASCESNPCAALPTGETGGEGLRLITRNVIGLQPATTYHFRLVATNASGTIAGPDRTFTTFASGAKLPDDRAYEMVSPPEKNGANVEPNRSVMAAADGHAVVFGSLGSFADAPSSPVFNYYRAQRGATLWSTRGISPPLPPNGKESLAAKLEGVSSDLGRVLMEAHAGEPEPPGEAGTVYLYRRETPDGTFGGFLNLTPQIPALTPEPVEFGDANESLSTVGIESQLQLTPDAPPNGETKAYVWSAEDEQLHYVGIYPDGAPMTKPQVQIGAGAHASLTKNAVSSDGSQVIFEAESALYLRRNPSQPQSPLAHGGATGSGDLESGSPTVQNVVTETGAFAVGQTITGAGIPFGTTVTAASPGTLTLSASAAATSTGTALVATSECTDPTKACTVEASASHRAIKASAAGAEAIFAGSSPAGNRILFKTSEQLLDSDTNNRQDLYLYERESGELRRISVDGNLTDGDGTEFIEVMASGEDVEDVYFAATDMLVPGQPELPGTHIYAWHDDGTPDGSLSYVATLDESLDGFDWDKDPAFKEPLVQASPNGRYLLFTAKTSLGAYDNVKPSGCGFFKTAEGLVVDPDPHCSELYRYDSEAPPGERLVCVSCDPSGEAATGDAVMWDDNASVFKGISVNGFVSHNVFDDGRVVFNTEDGLTPSDSNGKSDVYEWEDGGPTLISDAGESAATFANATSSGNDIFFNTADRLVGWDTDNNIDLYDARVGGGLPEPPPAPQSCEGDACQPPPLTLNDPTPASSTFFGSGNVGSRHPRRSRCPKGKRKVGAKGKTHCVKRSKRMHHRADRNRKASR